jgi:hypothetical protein
LPIHHEGLAALFSLPETPGLSGVSLGWAMSKDVTRAVRGRFQQLAHGRLVFPGAGGIPDEPCEF